MEGLVDFIQGKISMASHNEFSEKKSALLAMLVFPKKNQHGWQC